MSGLMQSLDIARKALWASRMAVDVTSNNIANVNTPGYSRQRVELTTDSPINLGFGPLGTGVLANRITRARSQLLDGNLRDAYTRRGTAENKQMVLQQVDAILKEPGENGLSGIISDFFNEWSNVANDPESIPARNVLLQRAKDLSGAMNRTYEQLNNTRAKIGQDAGQMVNDINDILKQIAELNQRINYSETDGASANDLRDSRDLLLDKLSEYGGVHFAESSQGMLNVSFEGVTLVTGTDYNELKLTTSAISDGPTHLSVQMSNSGQTFSVQNGKLGSYLNQFNDYLPGKMQELDKIASTIINEVNNVHKLAYGLPSGTPPTAPTGLSFFYGNSASSMRISTELEGDPSKIALSTTGEPGDVEAALTISNFANTPLLDGRSKTISDYYAGFVSQIGLDMEAANTAYNQEDLTVAQMENQRDSFSGVNLDEEMINLTRFQRSYEAASKVIKTVDELMQTVLSLK